MEKTLSLSDVGERLTTFCKLVSHMLSNYCFFGG